jgi:hypothetical protein
MTRSDRLTIAQRCGLLPGERFAEMSQLVLTERDREDKRESEGARSQVDAPRLFETDTVRVRDLTGEIVVRDDAPRRIVVTRALRGGGLRLDWYDVGIVALIAAALVASIVCLLHGV